MRVPVTRLQALLHLAHPNRSGTACGEQQQWMLLPGLPAAAAALAKS
jgi:hypothetical protein